MPASACAAPRRNQRCRMVDGSHSLHMVPPTACRVLLIALVTAAAVAVALVAGDAWAVCLLTTAALTSTMEARATGTAANGASGGAVLAAAMLGTTARCCNTAVAVAIC